jgi:eukaryotic-like serine/threonine-protein kinase
MAVLPGDRLGPYEILEPLGAGGMGEVYKARDIRLDRLVAIKSSHERFSERFEREARAVAALNHPHICTLYDIGEDYLVMEYIEGDRLSGPLPVRRALELGGQILDALDAAHRRGVIHRDLKPANILVTKQGIKLLDFGIARMQAGADESTAVTTEVTRTGVVMGTPAYMAPELWAGKTADARSDLYAFGCVLYEMLTGKPISLDRAPVEPVALETVLQTCLATDPDDRWQSASDLRRELSRVLDHRRVWWPYAAAAVFIAAVVAGFVLWQQRAESRPLTDTDVLVLADFANMTGEPVFDTTLREAFAVRLEQSPFLKVMDDERVRLALKSMGRANDEPITRQLARELCIRERVKAMIGGSVASIGRRFVVTFQATNCGSGETIAREQVEAEDKEHVLSAVGTAVNGMRAKLGESLSSIQRFDAPPMRVTTTSLEAFQAFAAGGAQFRAGQWLAAVPSFRRATELDPGFAMAYQMLGMAYNNAQDGPRSIEPFTKAFALRDTVSERERLNIASFYFTRVTGELDKAADALQVYVQAYPRDSTARIFHGLLLKRMGEFEKAAREEEEAIRLAAGGLVAYGNLISTYGVLDRFDEAKMLGEQAIAGKQDGSGVHQNLLWIAHIQGDQAAATREIDWLTRNASEMSAVDEQALNAVVRGRRREAAELFTRGAELARRRNLVAALHIRAQATSGDAYADCAAFDTVAGAPVACGDLGAALKTTEARSREQPNATVLNAVELPILRATIELQRDDPAKAIEVLAAAAPYERAYAQAIYLRGLAYLRLRKGTEAATEFRKIVSRKGANFNSRFPLSHVGLARAELLSGNTGGARRTYEQFLSLWKDADPDIPLLIAAKSEYAALQ